MTNLEKKNIKVILAPSYELALTVNADATVEAEYGDECVTGKLVTLAHHGSRCNNPAPCNTPNVTVLPDNSTIIVSHLDLDTLGGIMTLTGDKIEFSIADQLFWKAAEFIDVNGTHHMSELGITEQEKLNAFYAFNRSMSHEKATDLTDVTSNVVEYFNAIYVILDTTNALHNTYIKNGTEWLFETTQAVENCLYLENEKIRAFMSDGPFCAAAYYSPKQQLITKATITYNIEYNSITIAFEDGGKVGNACEIVQRLWGPLAGGHRGIAGSPRGEVMSKSNFLDAISEVERVLN